jgi:hypothetical protein
VATSHQKSSRAGYQDYASGSDAVGAATEHHGIKAYRVGLRFSDQPRYILRAEGVETLECVRPRDERESSRALQPGVIIGWMDWDKVEPVIFSG